MKTTNILASCLLGSLAAAVPMNKRALVTKTEVVMETVVVFTTVWGDAPAAQAAPTPGLFYEHPSDKPKPPAFTPEAPKYTPPPPPPPPQKQPPPPPPPPVNTPAPPPPPPPPVNTPAPPPPPPPPATPAFTPPPVQSAAPAQPSQPSQPAGQPSGGQPSGEKYTGDVTIYDNTGHEGACGQAVYDDMMVAAIAKPAWGQSTWDKMTGASTNPWCGQKIRAEFEGRTVDVTIMDMCEGCVGMDIDLTLKAWKQLTGLDEKTRRRVTWYKTS